MKYYAVRNGRRPGVYKSWAECEAQTKGFPGAIFKSFASEEDAKRFLNPEEKAPTPDSSLPAFYIDGSFNADAKTYGYGVYSCIDGAESVVYGTL